MRHMLPDLLLTRQPSFQNFNHMIAKIHHFQRLVQAGLTEVQDSLVNYMQMSQSFLETLFGWFKNEQQAYHSCSLLIAPHGA